MQFAHARNDGLARLFVGSHLERRILFCEAAQRNAKFFFVGLGLRLNRYRDHRFREHDRLEHDRCFLIAKRIAGTCFPQAHCCRYVSRANRLHFFAGICVHTQDT